MNAKYRWDDLRRKRAASRGGAALSGPTPPTPVRALYLDVPFSRRAEAKQLGARWDAQKKRWYVMAGSTKAERLLKLFALVESVDL